MALAGAKITLGNDVPISWRQNIINVKAFLTVMWNDQSETPRDPGVQMWKEEEEEEKEEGRRITLGKNAGSDK